MEKQTKDPAHARPATRKLIHDLLRERRQMLSLLADLIKLNLHNVDERVRTTLDEFLSILVDYLAAGHFGLYQRLAEGTERRQPVVEAARETYPRIAAITDGAVGFSERYESAPPQLLNDHLAQDLSRLAENLSSRIELEDVLITAMLGEVPGTASAA